MDRFINDRIKQILKTHFQNDTNLFANAINIPYSTLKDTISGNVDMPSSRTLAAIAYNKDMNINMNWLFTGEGKMYRLPEEDNVLCYEIQKNELVKTIGYLNIKDIDVTCFFKISFNPEVSGVKKGDIIGVTVVEKEDISEYGLYLISYKNQYYFTTLKTDKNRADILYGTSADFEIAEMPARNVNIIYQVNYVLSTVK
ncbi:MAG: hypothetical protein ACLVKO_01650 [Dysgonomonas sp.]